MCVGIIFVSVVGYGALRLLYRDINKLQNQDPPEIAGDLYIYKSMSIQKGKFIKSVAIGNEKYIGHFIMAELKHEIELWRRAAARVSVVSREESIMKALFQQKAAQRENALIRQLYRMR